MTGAAQYSPPQPQPQYSPPQPQPQYSPAQLARMLGAQEPTPEQAAVIGAPLAPMAVIAGAGSEIGRAHV